MFQNKIIHRFLLLLGSVFLFSACSSIPEGATAVQSFDKARYLGTWYEIARFDVRFERDLNNTTATYSLNEDGTIKVVNQGFNYKKNEWEKATGKAKFVGADDVARLKVSFFGPFYGGYNVVALDDDYQYALIAGGNLDYLWILSRKTTIPEDIKAAYLKKAKEIGYDTDALLWVEHDRVNDALSGN